MPPLRTITVCLGYKGDNGEARSATFDVEAYTDRQAFDKAEELLLQRLLADAARRALKCHAHYYESDDGVRR